MSTTSSTWTLYLSCLLLVLPFSTSHHYIRGEFGRHICRERGSGRLAASFLPDSYTIIPIRRHLQSGCANNRVLQRRSNTRFWSDKQFCPIDITLVITTAHFPTAITAQQRNTSCPLQNNGTAQYTG